MATVKGTAATRGGFAKIWWLVLAAIVVLAAAGGFVYLRFFSGPDDVKMASWEWRRTGQDAMGNIEGELLLNGTAARPFILTGVECDVPVVNAPALPRKVSGVEEGRYEIRIRLTLPAVESGKKPLNLSLDYRQRRLEGKLGPIVLYP